MLAKAGCNVDLTATTPTCLWYLLLNVKNDFLVAMLTSCKNHGWGCWGILFAIVQVVNANITDLVEGNICI